MAKTTNAAAEKVGVVLVDKVNEEVLNASLEKVGEPTNGGLKEKILRLGAWFSKHCDKEADLVDCSECRGVSDITKLDDSPLPHACPYCGDGEADGKVAAKPQVVDKPKAKAPEKARAKEPEVIEAKGEVIDMESRKQQKLTRVRTAKAEVVEKSGGGEAELDAKLDECKAALVEGAKSYIVLSQALRDIDEEKLWRHRVNSEGKKAYENFEQFARAELQMSRGHAYKAIAVAKVFSPEQIQKIGQSKLSLIAGFKDPEVRAALLKEVEKGTGKRGLQKKGRELAGKEGAEDTEEKVTVALMMKRVRIPLLARAGKDKPAKRLADDPHGEIELTNGVTLKFRLQTSRSGQIELVVTPQRSTD